jgi:hypothetical protein
MRWMAISVLAFAACGGPAVEWAGKWKEPASFPAGTYMEATLSGSGTTINGSGTQFREAGMPATFGVKGNAAATAGVGPYVDLTYQDGSTEHFSFAQDDADHLTLSGSQRTVHLTRE